MVQNPTTSLADDVAATKRVIAAQDGPVTLVGHSYGGAVITEAGNDPKVSKLVYIAGFAPDKGESVNTLIADPPPGAPVPPILPPQDGFLSGNLMIGQQQIWLGPARAGLPVIVWVDTDGLHVLGVDGGRIKTTASRLSQRDLARLRADGGRTGQALPHTGSAARAADGGRDRPARQRARLRRHRRRTTGEHRLTPGRSTRPACAWTGSSCTSSTRPVTSCAHQAVPDHRVSLCPASRRTLRRPA